MLHKVFPSTGNEYDRSLGTTAAMAVGTYLDLVHQQGWGCCCFRELVTYDQNSFGSPNTHHNRKMPKTPFRSLLEGLPNLNDSEDSNFSTWLIRITLNQSLMKLRKQRPQ